MGEEIKRSRGKENRGPAECGVGSGLAYKYILLGLPRCYRYITQELLPIRHELLPSQSYSCHRGLPPKPFAFSLHLDLFSSRRAAVELRFQDEFHYSHSHGGITLPKPEITLDALYSCSSLDLT